MITIQETILRLFLGAILGSLIGVEREVHGRAAGLRTQLIVCMASVLIMIISENFYLKLPYNESVFRLDPGRIASGAIIGIGFLGAGVIVKSGFTIRGLTTAASLWIVTAIGLAIGGGFYFEGCATAFITIIALVFLRKMEKRIKILLYKTITISTPIMENAEETIISLLSDCGLHIHAVDYEKNQSKGELIYNFHVSTRNINVLKDLFQKLGKVEFIKKIRIV
jgi:putative Mg2+ transporter-C (MgtC) family protein